MSQQNVETVPAALDAFNRGDWDALFTHAAPDFEFDNTRNLGEWRGVHTTRDQVMRAWERFAKPWESVHFEAEQLFWPFNSSDSDGSGPERDTARTMSQENVEIVRRLWADLETENLEASIHLLDERVELWNAPEFPVTGPYRGHDGVRQWAAEQWEVFSGLHHEIEEIIEAPDGETLVSVQRTQGRMRHTEMKTNVQWATTWTIRDGKVLRAYGYLTRAEALEAAGLSE